MEHPKYINPFTDFGFKKIFGEEANKDLLIDFLNELLAYENEKIADLIYKNSEHLGRSSGIDRNVIFDLFCENEKGEKFNVELQKEKIFQKVFQIAEYTAMTNQEKNAYEHSLKYYRDLQNSLDTATADGIAKGIAEGIAKTEEKYSKIIDGKDQIINGKDKSLFESAKLMKQLGATIEQIKKSTGFTDEEIENL